MSNDDKVLAELARRMELAKAATPGPWRHTVVARDKIARVHSGDWDPDSRIVAHVWFAEKQRDPNGDFIADSGTHRARELEALELAVRLFRAYAVGDIRQIQVLAGISTNVTSFQETLDLVAKRIERAILGDGGEK